MSHTHAHTRSRVCRRTGALLLLYAPGGEPRLSAPRLLACVGPGVCPGPLPRRERQLGGDVEQSIDRAAGAGLNTRQLSKRRHLVPLPAVSGTRASQPAAISNQTQAFRVCARPPSCLAGLDSTLAPHQPLSPPPLPFYSDGRRARWWTPTFRRLTPTLSR